MITLTLETNLIIIYQFSHISYYKYINMFRMKVERFKICRIFERLIQVIQCDLHIEILSGAKFVNYVIFYYI